MSPGNVVINVSIKNQPNFVSLGVVPMDFGVTQNTQQEVIQNVQTILSTPITSVPLYRQFGTNYSFVDYPINVAMNMIVASFLQAIVTWEPRATIVGLKFTGDVTGTVGNLIVNVTIVINLQGNTPSAVLSGAQGIAITVVDTSTGVPVVQVDTLID
jgi:phage baseplate assembly protein W